ncbi:MAG: restriction endonuclease [Actinomycetes bacterium]
MTERNAHEIVAAIGRSGFSIYSPVEVGSDLWITSPELELLLNEGLRSFSLGGLPLRTRSKTVKEEVCRLLGYPTPKSFQKTHPRFFGQMFDVYVQKSNNLQIWNDELSAVRRYVLIRVSTDGTVERVRVVTGDTLALLDTTGTLTQKYQARLSIGDETTELVSNCDTANMTYTMLREQYPVFFQSPTDYPTIDSLLPIEEIFNRLRLLVGSSFKDTGHDQERNRGAELHRMICQQLGYAIYRDDGRFPDIRNQLLEVKLQTSPTIDLGLVRPDSQELLDLPQINGRQIRHCDVRYAIFYGHRDGQIVTLSHFYLTTGEAFFSRFNQFQGKVLNKKLQIPLPRTFFN